MFEGTLVEKGLNVLFGSDKKNKKLKKQTPAQYNVHEIYKGDCLGM